MGLEVIFCIFLTSKHFFLKYSPKVCENNNHLLIVQENMENLGDPKLIWSSLAKFGTKFFISYNTKDEWKNKIVDMVNNKSKLTNNQTINHTDMVNYKTVWKDSGEMLFWIHCF